MRGKGIRGADFSLSLELPTTTVLLCISPTKRRASRQTSPPASIATAPATIAAPATGTSRTPMMSAQADVIVIQRCSPHPATHFLGKRVEGFAHLGIAEVHLPVEMIGQPPVIVEPAQIGAADITHLELLVTRRTRGIRQLLEFLFALCFCLLGLAYAVVFVDGAGDLPYFAEDLDFEETVVDTGVEVGDTLELERGGKRGGDKAG